MVREKDAPGLIESCANESKIMGVIPTNERVCFPSLFHVLAFQRRGFRGVVGIRAGM